MKKVLIADDNKNHQLFLSVILQKYFDCDILTADNGTDTLNSIQHNNPDLLLLDIGMPGLDGIQVLERLRLNFNDSLLPVIIISGYDERSVLYKLLALGISDFLKKPMNIFSIYQKVRKHIPSLNLMEA
ncbi:MAG: response regulator [Ignavibacteriales bacterium]|nr:MAG: response regulator [Ignavibacteriales bacterium]